MRDEQLMQYAAAVERELMYGALFAYEALLRNRGQHEADEFWAGFCDISRKFVTVAALPN